MSNNLLTFTINKGGSVKTNCRSNPFPIIMTDMLLHQLFFHSTIVSQLSKCLKFEAVWGGGVLTDQMI